MERSGRQTVLVVDDVETNLDTLVETLGDVYDVAVAMDGPSALQLVAEQPPEGILLDILMPGMDGYEVCRRLKANPATADIPVLFLTALTEIENKINGFDLGAVDYITKPFDALEVKARVGTHLNLKAAMERLERQNQELAEAARLREDVEHITHHDLKGPLSAIISLPQLILAGENLTGEQREYLDIIEQSGYKMLNIVNLSLSLLKMEKGHYQLSPELVDIRRVLGKVIVELRALRDAKRLTVEICRENGLSVDDAQAFLIRGEELLCYSMFSNLLKNAFEHSPTGVPVTITVGVEPRGGCFVRITNQGETAPGIRERFFEKYTTYGKTGGTGLGTYSAWLMARTMGGDLELDASRPGETTLVAHLPCAY